MYLPSRYLLGTVLLYRVSLFFYTAAAISLLFSFFSSFFAVCMSKWSVVLLTSARCSVQQDLCFVRVGCLNVQWYCCLSSLSSPLCSLNVQRYWLRSQRLLPSPTNQELFQPQEMFFVMCIHRVDPTASCTAAPSSSCQNHAVRRHFLFHHTCFLNKLNGRWAFP